MTLGSSSAWQSFSRPLDDGFLLWWAIAFETSPGRLAVEVGLLLSVYSVWALASGSLLLSKLRLKDANVELAALQATSIVVFFALLLLILGFLNLFGVLPWK